MSDLDLHPSSKSVSRQHLREDQVVTAYARAWVYFDEHRVLVYGMLAVLVLVIIAGAGYTVYLGKQQDKAEQLLAGPVQAYEANQFQVALEGQNARPGLLAIADEYGNTESGNLARFYAANALFHTGQYDKALTYFEEFEKDGDLLGASAIAGEAAVYEEKGDFSRAAELYRKAADFYENKLTTPQYLLNAARAYESAGEYQKALDLYSEIKEEYTDFASAGNIDVFIARAKAEQSNPS
ncbi:MAG TPA: tetratricopeptide repeat protein [Rhodothermales bacterium]|nr:tetratricopeptide repeat protein [Rhodothermales bacterium]